MEEVDELFWCLFDSLEIFMLDWVLLILLFCNIFLYVFVWVFSMFEGKSLSVLVLVFDCGGLFMLYGVLLKLLLKGGICCKGWYDGMWGGILLLYW